MYILSIDPSLSSTGWSVLLKNTKEVIDYGRITTKSKEEEDDRIFYIASKLIDICVKYDIKYVAAESQYLAKNARTAMQLSRLRGGIAVGLKLKGIAIEYLPPSIIKKAVTGKGNAEKEVVMEVLCDIYEGDKKFKTIGPFVDKNRKDKTSDIYDAVAIGYTYCTGYKG